MEQNNNNCSRGETLRSPLATIEDIQKRLIPPSILSNHQLNPLEFEPDRSDSWKLNEKIRRSEEEGRNPRNRSDLVTRCKKLEDYLDPVILSRIRLNMKEHKEDVIMIRGKENFDWPGDEDLKSFTEVSRTFKKRKLSDGIVRLRDDVEINIVDDHDEQDQEEEGDGDSSPFRQFERTASKLLKE